MAVVEIVNENSIFHHWVSGKLSGKGMSNYATWADIPPSYERDLTARFNAWLVARLTPADLAKVRAEAGVAAGAPVPRLNPSGFRGASALRFQTEAAFYEDLETRFFLDMSDYLKNTLGVKAPLDWQQRARRLQPLWGVEFHVPAGYRGRTLLRNGWSMTYTRSRRNCRVWPEPLRSRPEVRRSTKCWTRPSAKPPTSKTSMFPRNIYCSAFRMRRMSAARDALASVGATHEAILKALTAVRGSRRGCGNRRRVVVRLHGSTSAWANRAHGTTRTR